MSRFHMVCGCAAIAVLCGGAMTQAQSDEPKMYIAPAGATVKSFQSNIWGFVGGELRNPTENELNLVAATAFADELDEDGGVIGWSNVQFTTKLWAPPHSRQSFQLLVRTGSVPKGIRSVPIISMLLDASQEPMIQLSRESASILPARDKFITGLIRARYADDAIDAAVAARLSSSLSRRLNFARTDSAPTTVFGWQGLNALILARPDLNLDSAQRHALRQWVASGGNLWIMLDKVDQTDMQRLLSDDWSIEVIDRVDLNTFTIEGRDVSFELDVEEPIEMVRVLAIDMEVLHRVRGYPASLRRSIGLGKLLVTTLGPRAWVNHRRKIEIELVDQGQRDAMAEFAASALEPDAEIEPDEETGSLFVTTKATHEQLIELRSQAQQQGLNIRHLYKLVADPEKNKTFTPPLKELARWFNKGTAAMGRYLPQMEALLNDQLGYRIVGSGPIVAVLSAFCALVLLSGLWLSGRNQLEHVGWIGLCAAIIATLVLVGLGAQKRQQIPLTVASSQFVQVLPAQHESITAGMVQVYNPDKKRMASIHSTNGAVVWPSDTATGDSIVRMVRTDVDQWHWQDLVFAGDTVVQAEVLNIQPLEQPMGAKLTFGASGVTGSIASGDLGQLEDVILATPDGTLPVRISGEDFTAGPQDVLVSGQFIRGGMLGAAQKRRQNLYRMLFAEQDYPDVPMVLGWASSWDAGVRLLQDAESRDSVLVAIPLVYQQSPPGTQIVIPSTLVGFGSVKNSGGRPLDIIFTNQARKWVRERTMGGNFQFAFTLPREVSPFHVEKATVLTNLDVAGRGYELLAIPNKRLYPAQKLPIEVQRGSLVQLTIPVVGELGDLSDQITTVRLRVAFEEMRSSDVVSATVYGMAMQTSTGRDTWLDADVPTTAMGADQNVLTVAFESGTSESLTITSIEHLVPLHHGSDPSGLTEIELNPPPQPDPHGRIVLELHVDHAAGSMNLWQLDRLEMTVSGHVLEQVPAGPPD